MTEGGEVEMRYPKGPCILARAALSTVLLHFLSAPTAEAAPNVLILVADDLGWADVGYHGSDIQTPNIDSLASDGVQLDRLYVAPSCTPTRTALMTGRNAHRLGLGWFPIMPWSNKAVSPKERFVAQDFQAAGYQTGIVGKWHLGHTLEVHGPNARGFDHFFGHLHTGVDYYEHTAPAGGYDLQQNGRSVRRRGRYLTDVHGEEAVRFIRERDPSRPFFLYVPFLAPHSPMQAPPELVEKYAHREDPIKRVYAAMVDSLDQAIGAILQELQDQDLVEDTIVVFLSDNGGSTNLGGENTPLRGGKQTPFEGGIRVPGIIRWPAELGGAETTSHVVSVLDLYPTLARAAGVSLGNSRPLDGMDQWAALSSGLVAPRKSDLFFSGESATGSPEYTALLSGRWKLIQLVEREQVETHTTRLLFDIEADPFETSDLAGQHPDVVRDLSARISSWRSRHPVSGQRVEIVPHPGWRSPVDWASAMLPRKDTISDLNDVYPQQDRTVENLQRGWSDRGRVEID